MCTPATASGAFYRKIIQFSRFLPLLCFLLTACDTERGNHDKAASLPSSDETASLPPSDETAALPSSIAGEVQKGPFVSGSSITIQELNEDLIPTGKMYQTTTSDDFGAFALAIDKTASPTGTFTSKFIEIIANGYYFDEVKGVLSDGPLTLRAIADISSESRIQVNALTTLEENRIKSIIEKGTNFTDARAQAEDEILAIFGIPATGISAFNEMDVSETGESNAVLLAVSALLQGKNSVAQLSELISKLNIDIGDNGVLDQVANADACRSELVANGRDLDLAAVRANLARRYAELGLAVEVPSFENYVDSDGDGVINFYDTNLVFAAVTAAEPNSAVVSNEVRVGLPPTITEASVSIDGGVLLINGIENDTNATVTSGDRLAIRITSGSTWGANRSARITVGDESFTNTGIFEVTTRGVNFDLTEKIFFCPTCADNNDITRFIVFSSDRSKAYVVVTNWQTPSYHLSILGKSTDSAWGVGGFYSKDGAYVNDLVLGDEPNRAHLLGRDLSTGQDVIWNADFSSSTDPILVPAPLEAPSFGIGETISLAAHGSRIYLGRGLAFQVLQAAGSSAFSVITTAKIYGVAATAFSSDGRTACVSDVFGLSVMDLSDADHPKIVGTSSARAKAVALSANGKIAFILEAEDRYLYLTTVDVSTPSKMVTLGRHLLGAYFEDRTLKYRLAVAGDQNAIFVSMPTEVLAFSVANPADPVEIGKITPDQLPANSPRFKGIAVNGDRLFVTSNAGVAVFSFR